MKAAPALAGLVGFAGGSAVVVATLALELLARGGRVRGGLSDLQLQSVTVWVLESIPFLLAAAAVFLVHERQATRADARSQPSLPPSTGTPPPVPDRLQQNNLLDQPPPNESEADSGQRVAALQELVKVLKDNLAKAANDHRTRSATVARVSRDLRAPLNELIACAEELADDGGAPSDRRSPERILEASRGLVRLVDHLIDQSRIDAGALELVLVDVDVPGVIEEVQALLASEGGGVGEMAVSLDPDARLAVGDHTRVRRTVASAVRHLGQGGAPVELSVDSTGTMPGSRISICVRRAEGHPLPPDAPTSQLRLELEVAEKLAKLMGGRLEVTGDPGAMGPITLTLPCANTTVGWTVELGAPPLEGLQVVLVDKDPGADGLAAHLEREGFEILHLKDGERANELLATCDHPFVLLDGEWPDVWETLETAVSESRIVWLLSLRDEDTEPALRLGATSCLTRPVDRNVLVTALRAVARREAAQDRRTPIEASGR